MLSLSGNIIIIIGHIRAKSQVAGQDEISAAESARARAHEWKRWC